MSARYIRQEPYVNNHGIYIPDNEYVPEGCTSLYKCVITKEMFIDAYNKWIKCEPSSHHYGEDDADCWSE